MNEEHDEYAQYDARWLMLSKELAKSGVKVTREFSYIMIQFTQYEYLWIYFHQDKRPTYALVARNFTASPCFGDFFESLSQEYKEIFCFYLDLFDDNVRLKI
jgi:hypothetical protein